MRKRSPDQLPRLLDAATRVFIAHSYRQARMSQVAEEAGLASGTLYLYFDSKEALFLTTVRRAFLGEAFELPSRLPIPRPQPDDILDFIRERFDTDWLPTQIAGAVRQTVASGDIRTEFEGILGELYDWICDHRYAIRLVERSAIDWPELFDLHFKRMRRRNLALLTEYLTQRIEAGQLRPVPEPATTARVIVENCAWFAMHRHFAPDSHTITDADARTTVLHILMNGLCPAGHDG